MIVVSAKQGLELVPALSDEKTKAAAMAQLLEMAAKGEATLAGTLVARGTVGEKIMGASVEEVRYPVEFDKPTVPDTFFDPQRPPTNEAQALQMLKSWPFVGISPTAFNTRVTGLTMEVTLAVADRSGLLRCHFNVHDVKLKQFDKIETGRLANGERLDVQQPRFTEMKTEGTALLASGKPELLAAHRLPTEEPKVELVILTLRFTAP